MADSPNIPKRKLPPINKQVGQQAQPSQIQKLFTQGLVTHQQGKLSEAKAIYEQILKMQPNNFSALQLMGAMYTQTKNHLQAIEFLSKAIKINPQFAPCYNNIGLALKELNRLDEALASYDKAINIIPDYAEAYFNRGNTLKELMRLDEAVESYDKAIAIKADDASAHWNLSLCHLLNGNFNSGWQEYEWGWATNQRGSKRSFPQPLWLGVESLKDKTILLHDEQGLGDTIQFCRYAPLVAERGAKVVLEVQRPLVKLLKNLEGVSQTIAKGDTLPAFDYQCPVMSLPLAFKTELNTIPPVSKNITSNDEMTIKWQTELGEKVKPRVGLVWSGSTTHVNDHNRSLTLSHLLPYLPSHMEYVCLQKELRDIDKVALEKNPHIQFYGDALEDFTDTAALCDLMDIVISVDTSVAHLAPSLGKQTWVLLPYSPDWRWLLDRDDSPWYPSVKLFRQEKIGNWNGVLDRLKVDLLKI